MRELKPMEDAAEIRELLEKYKLHPEFLGLEIKGVDQVGNAGDALIHILARQGKLDDIAILLKHGASISKAGDCDNTPLHFAAMAGKAEMVEYLIAKGADLRARNVFAQTPQDVSRLSGHTAIAALLASAH